MHEEELRKQFEAFLRNPSEVAMNEFLKRVKQEILDIPTCPKCGLGHAVKIGFNPRKHGPEQQFRCSGCRHIYTRSAIKSREMKAKCPKCKYCGSPSKRSGFWKWTVASGARRKQQRYECINSTCGAFFSLGLPETVQP